MRNREFTAAAEKLLRVLKKTYASDADTRRTEWISLCSPTTALFIEYTATDANGLKLTVIHSPDRGIQFSEVVGTLGVATQSKTVRFVIENCSSTIRVRAEWQAGTVVITGISLERMRVE